MDAGSHLEPSGCWSGGRWTTSAFVEPSNTASMRVLESAGFQREGYLRSYLAIGDGRADAYIYSLLATDLD